MGVLHTHVHRAEGGRAWQEEGSGRDGQYDCLLGQDVRGAARSALSTPVVLGEAAGAGLAGLPSSLC